MSSMIMTADLVAKVADVIGVTYEKLLRAIGINFIGNVIISEDSSRNIAANTDFFTNDLNATLPRSRFRIKILPTFSSGSPVLKVGQTPVGGGVKNYGAVNGNATLVTNEWYTIDFPVADGKSINLQVTATITLTSLEIIEVND